MSLVAAALTVAMASSPVAPLAEAEPIPVRCRPAPYYVADRAQGPMPVTRLNNPSAATRSAADKPAPCYLTRGRRPQARAVQVSA